MRNSLVTVRKRTGKVVTKEFMLNLKYRINNVAGTTILRKFYPDFEPATTTMHTASANGQLRLDEITGFAIAMGPNPGGLAGGKVWRPRRVSLQLNGRVVHDVTFAQQRDIRPGQSLQLAFPPKPPAQQRPIPRPRRRTAR